MRYRCLLGPYNPGGSFRPLDKFHPGNSLPQAVLAKGLHPAVGWVVGLESKLRLALLLYVGKKLSVASLAKNFPQPPKLATPNLRPKAKIVLVGIDALISW
jgi:hypothetical protein